MGLNRGKKIHTKNLAKYLLTELLFSSEDLTSTKGKKTKTYCNLQKANTGKTIAGHNFDKLFWLVMVTQRKKIVSIKDNKLGKYFFPLQCLTELNLSIRGDLLLDTTKKSYIKTIIYPNHNPKLSCAG